MEVTEQSRLTTVTIKVTLSAQDIAQSAGLNSPDQWAFADGGPDAMAVLTHTE